MIDEELAQALYKAFLTEIVSYGDVQAFHAFLEFMERLDLERAVESA